MDFQTVGKLLVFGGVIMLVMGGIFLLLGRTPFTLGSLPGDIRIQRENFSCFVPITSMIVISIVLTLVVNILLRIINR